MNSNRLLAFIQNFWDRADWFKTNLTSPTTLASHSLFVRATMGLLRFLRVLFLETRENLMWQRAASMTYTTILALFPLLILITSLGSVFYTPQQEEKLIGFIEQRLMPPTSAGLLNPSEQARKDERQVQIKNLTGQIRNMSDAYRKSAGGVGSVGFAGLLLTAFFMYKSIESAFEASWETGDSKSFTRSLAGFSMLVLLAPVIVGLSITISSIFVGLVGDAEPDSSDPNVPSMTESIKMLVAHPELEPGQDQITATDTSVLLNDAATSPMATEEAAPAPPKHRHIPGLQTISPLIKIFFSIVPTLFNCIILALAYLLIPKADVKMSYALLGGLVAGILWELAKVGFFFYIYLSTAKRELLQALGAIPIFLIWIYFTWIVFLLGNEITYSSQNFARLMRKHFKGESPSYLDGRLHLAVAMLVADAFEKGQHGIRREELAKRIRLPIATFEEIVDALLAHEFLTVTDKNKLSLSMPARKVRLVSLLKLGCDPGSLCETNLGTEENEIAAAINAVQKKVMAVDENTTLADLLKQSQPSSGTT